ncbi:hypothetical protein BX070DRAFT_220859 [Coemansia spiralis]|nr:hypothetical protein BX070DRAFT_220859 [Coemansia spiralis]
MERAGMERAGSRGWRRSGAQRADAADRWEHDRFDAQSTRSRERRNSAQPMDIQHIGKQGISHVTISRRDSSTLAASYDAPRRPPVLQPRSPRSPPGSGFQSYRAPHRRQGSGDHCAERDPKAVEDTEGSSAEIEWENFVANGGLELPFDRITDELLVKQPRPAQPKLSYHAEGTPARRRRPADDLQDAGAARLNGDGDAADKAGRSSRGANPSSLKAQKGIAIRGAAKTPESFGAAIDQVAAPQARRPSATPAKPPKPAADPVGIRIKGTTPVPNGARADAQPPAKPTGPSSRPSTPTKPSTPPRATLSRPSSNEGRSTMPSTYLRRQFEGYDEDRGRHIFSVNIPYDDNRYAPIHVHEKDDLARLAAKFARTWRLQTRSCG